MTKIYDLKSTIEDLRLQKYSYLPEEIVLQILDIETSFCEDRQEAIKRVEKAVNEYLDKDGLR